MGYIDVDDSTFTTGGDSALALTTTKPLTGRLHAIQYVRDSTATALSTAASLVVTAARTGTVILSIGTFNSTVDTIFYPRQNIHSTAGSTIAGFTEIPLYNEGLTYTISSGGAAKGGRFRAFVE